MPGTGYIILPLPGATVPDGTGTNNGAPQPVVDVSTGTQATNTPKVTTFCWDFATPTSTTEQHLLWTFMLPGNASGGMLMKIKWKMMTGNTGSASFKASSISLPDDSATHNTLAFDPPTIQTLAVAGTAGILKEFSFSLNSLSGAANRLTTVMIGSDSAAWTATGVLRVLSFTIEYGLV